MTGEELFRPPEDCALGRRGVCHYRTLLHERSDRLKNVVQRPGRSSRDDKVSVGNGLVHVPLNFVDSAHLARDCLGLAVGIVADHVCLAPLLASYRHSEGCANASESDNRVVRH